MARTRYVIGLIGLAVAVLLTGCGSSNPATPTPTRPTWTTPPYTPTYSPSPTTEAGAEFEDTDTSTTTATKRAQAAPRTAATTRRTQPPVKASAYYANCAAARAAGAAPLHRGETGYRAGLDRDSDGVACEK